MIFCVIKSYIDSKFIISYFFSYLDFRIEEDNEIVRDLNRSGLIHQNKNCIIQ